ncbi:exopolyphosphatase, partial [bacterium]|nr:exopolyphosphatase [bacterium]
MKSEPPKKQLHKLKFGAINVGTNAARLLLSNVYFDGAHPVFKKIGLYRIPLQLGDDVFSTGKISEKKAGKLIETIQAFSHLLNVFHPIAFRACATSAMREAENGVEIAEQIRQKTGIDIQIIDGKAESELIYLNHRFATVDPTHNYLYIDVGGGSTELTYFSHRQPIVSHSFKIGTLRILNNWVDDSEWRALKQFIKKSVIRDVGGIAVGTGGNISKVLSLAGLKNSKTPISYETISKIHKKLLTHTIEDRIIKLGLKPDRAEVIIPALDIYLKIMKWANLDQILIPKVGLSDGIIHHLF